MWHCLVKVEPLNTTSGLREAVCAASADLKEICALNGEIWEPAILDAPSLALRTWNGDFGDGVGPGAMSMSLALEVLGNTYPDAEGHDWSKAPATLYVGKIGMAWPWTTMFKGRVSDYDCKGRILSFRAEVDTEPFDADVLTQTYAGTGGAEGGTDIKGQVKPLVLGHAKNVEPVLINATDSVYQFSGYGPIEAVTTLFERASDFGASQGDYADYAALVAASIPPGRWATCLDEGLVRLGAPAFGVITGDVRGHEVSGATPRLTGAMISALASLAGVSGALLETATLSAMDTDKPYNGNIVLTEQTSFIDLARRLTLACNHQACISLTGQLFVTKPDFTGAADLTLNAQGRALPQVRESEEKSTSAPYAKFIFGADRCWRVQGIDELAGGYVPKGIYDAAAFYKRDEWVFAPSPDGRAFVYINATPGSGHALPTAPDTSNSYWELFGAATAGATADQVADIAQALTDAANAQATADGKIESFYQTSAPASASVGDLWFDTDDGNKQYRWSGSAWIAVQDAGIGSAISAAAGAQATADGKVTTFVAESAPTADAVGDLWFKASTGELRRWNGTAWGDPLVDLTSSAVPRHEPSDASLSFTANYQGTLDGGQLPATVQFRRWRGSTDVSSSATWSLVSQGSITGGTVSVANGVVTIPSGCVIPPSTTITVKSVRDSFEIVSTIGVTRIDAAPPVPSGGGGGSGGGTSATDTTLNAVSGTTKIAVSDLMTVTTGSAGTITFAGSLSLSALRAAPDGTFGVAMRWKYRPVGGSFSDVGASDIAETTEAEVFYDAELDFYFGSNGSVNVAATLTGLSATTDYEVQLWGARDSASPTKDVFFGGTVSATGS